MLIRTLDYYGDFRCLAGSCPHSCCSGWEVVVDEETACRYETVPGPLGDKLRSALRRDGEDLCFSLDGGRCPFLDDGGLCEIHSTLGEDATSVTCREHPRFTEAYGPFREITLSASCPAANDLLLGTERPLTFLEWETAEPCESGDGWLAWLLPLRRRLLALLADRNFPLRRRLASFLELAWEGQLLLDDQRPEALAGLAAAWSPSGAAVLEGAGLLPGAMSFLRRLEILDPVWPVLLRKGETAAPVSVPEALLERIAVYFAFRYVLKTVNDGDLLGRAQLCLLAVLTVERLAAVCGLGEALRHFSREIEHSQENLDALQAAFWQEEAFAPERFLRELNASPRE